MLPAQLCRTLALTALVAGSATAPWLVLANPTRPSSPKLLTQAKPLSITCDTQSNPPKTAIQESPKAEMKPILSWYANYLMPQDSAEGICQDVAQKLRDRYRQNVPTFLTYQQIKNEWQVCFVSNEGDTCDATDSELLFKLNAAFKAPLCVMENTSPSDCPLNPVVRGPLMIVPGGTYKPAWWIFRP